MFVLIGLTVNVTPEEAIVFLKLLEGLKNKEVSHVGFQFKDNTSLFFDMEVYDFTFDINQQNRVIGQDTKIDSMYAIKVKGTMTDADNQALAEVAQQDG